jgi:gamma-glutamyltranspeptidase / glutathione hydrolase
MNGRKDDTAGAAATAHPAATEAALEILGAGGSAVDAAVAAQAALSVVLPQACGLGGDALMLVRDPAGRTAAINGVGRSAAEADEALHSDGGASVTVPGIVAAWQVVVARWGRLPLARVLSPAVRLAMEGFEMSTTLAAAIAAQRPRLIRGGAGDWVILHTSPGESVVQPVLGQTLASIGVKGAAAYYGGPLADAIAAAVERDGGRLSAADLTHHAVEIREPISIRWDTATVFVQPPPTQGVLLAMALHWLDDYGPPGTDELLDHVGIELTEEVFTYRDRCGRDGAGLLDAKLAVNLGRAERRGGPRAYLHTAGVAVADARGFVVSSLASIFDDFGAGTFVPEGGFVLNNRAAGFTAAPNHPGPAKQPVHTLAPALLVRAGYVLALATPGADGQVQTLLQVLSAMRYKGMPLVDAIAAPRWRSEGGRVLIGETHASLAGLRRRGHDAVVVDNADSRFGAVVAAGLTASSRGLEPFAAADWRREVHSDTI